MSGVPTGQSQKTGLPQPLAAILPSLLCNYAFVIMLLHSQTASGIIAGVLSRALSVCHKFVPWDRIYEGHERVKVKG